LVPFFYIENISEKIIIMNLKFYNNGYIITSKLSICSDIDDIMLNNEGEEVLFIIIEYLKNEIYLKKNEFFEKKNFEKKSDLDNEKVIENFINDNDNDGNNSNANEDISIIINHSKILVEKKSQFLSHFSYVYNMADVNIFKNTIFNDKKYGSATHNIFAYRFTCELTGIYMKILFYTYVYIYTSIYECTYLYTYTCKHIMQIYINICTHICIIT
jgi:hypothetical protein